ncbi:MAG: preprotein translocase subunit SecG [Pseudomonadales bacterium]|jgi:preprotein translocase subunit SecG|nr:preprotein translocase subunit SecG [Pseudomonadales bacterium]
MDLSTIESILLALLVLDAIALTVLVLVQQGKGADVGASFGSGSASTMFGSLGAASFFTKATAWLAIGFFLITFALAYIAKEKAGAAGTLGIPTAAETTSDAPARLTTPSRSDDTTPMMDEPKDGDVPEL